MAAERNVICRPPDKAPNLYKEHQLQGKACGAGDATVQQNPRQPTLNKGETSDDEVLGTDGRP